VADEGLNLGVVTEIVPADQMETGAGEVAERLTHLAPLRLAATKELMSRIPATWAPHRVAGEDLIRSCSRSDDFRGAVQAFVEKRKVTWTGRQQREVGKDGNDGKDYERQVLPAILPETDPAVAVRYDESIQRRPWR
jgi:hypothetical protein